MSTGKLFQSLVQKQEMHNHLSVFAEVEKKSVVAVWWTLKI